MGVAPEAIIEKESFSSIGSRDIVVFHASKFFNSMIISLRSLST
jgi:hypothetical protein